MIKTISLLLILPLLIASCSTAQEEQPMKKQEKKVAQHQKKSGIDFDKAVFIDVRTPGEYAAGTFEDAKNIPLNELNSRMDELNKDDQIVVFCQSGARASNALQILEKNGFTNVINGINTAKLQSLEK
tara:strand:- start:58867 stop:59250 length:384 start_codon:yes stop_codon:yes gene_type:complete